MTDIELLDKIPFTLDAERILKTLRLRKPNEHIERTVRELVERAQAVARPKAIYRVARVDCVEPDFVEIEGIRFTSRALSKNLESQNRVFPCIATCGRELETLPIPADDVLQSFCFETIKTWALLAANQYLPVHLKQRFAVEKLSAMNPGEFQDWPITQQRQLFKLFPEAEAMIGVRLNESNVMIPMKSRSGIFFASEVGFVSCQLCTLKKCPGRQAKFSPEKVKEYTGVSPTT